MTRGPEFAQVLRCGACQEVCAAGIDLPRRIREIHARIQDGAGRHLEVRHIADGILPCSANGNP
jgi:L-lactate utilization protein LutB